MSPDPLDGPDFCGLSVLRESDIPGLKLDMIILIERMKYAEAVYQGLHDLSERNGIPLYNMYGLNEIDAHRELESAVR